MSSNRLLSKSSWILVVYAVLIVLWGAWVRISGSGNGCGDHWPKCRGVFIPENAMLGTWIEYIHRIKSGLFGMLVTLLCSAVFFCFPKKSPQTSWAAASFIFTVSEALLGAGLVIFGLVDKSTSAWRLLVMPLHLTNTLALLGSLIVLSYSLSGIQLNWKGLSSPARKMLLVSGVAFLFVATSGALAALSTQLFPSTDLIEGLTRDLSSTTPVIERLRMLHLPLAVFGILACLRALRSFAKFTAGTTDLPALQRTESVALVAVLFGIATLLSLSPVWMKLTHLLLMNLVWISVVSSVVVIANKTRR